MIKVDDKGHPVLNPAGPNNPNGGFTGRMRNNLLDVIKEFRIQNQAPAQRMGIAEAAKHAQMNALNQSPFEARIQKLVERVAEAMEKAVAKLPGPPTTE